ncbi:Bypass of stop codon protein-like protein [Emericellopsis cladophorae]|uniref:Bypass of stop codon protein-like protein n=1 Tax=Emericellopsis cladophorae TaxID=2686198 RepID=A0A9P9Y0X7_9HYPO|nr:Bypass of stop codon protein-like protein [Emericellopsis cladophorae]KAI6780929.1 Bypass of stop codon protein-like protein [Emericellopsis cladophorae]
MSTTATVTQEAPAIELELARPPSTHNKHDGIVPQEAATSSPVGDMQPDDGSPPHAQGEVERWNKPRGNIGRLAFAFISFMIAGMNDAATGLEEYYDLTYTVVSLIFLTPFAGYSVAAFANARIHMTLGQRGIAIIAPLCHIITYVVLAVHPPWPVLVVINMISGFGNGLTDACFCAWVGAMDKANAIQGFLHATYSVGALFAPLIATNMVVTASLPWYTFYYVMIGISVLELVGLTVTFWRKTGEVYRKQHERANSSQGGAGTRVALKNKVTWLCAVFFFCYMGVEVGLGGWVVTFMLRVRKASRYASGISGTGFWAGMTVGRAGLGFVTERFGERLCVTIYLLLSVALQLLFWLVPNFIASAIAVAFLGVFLGPLFPGAVMVTAKLLPPHIHVSAIGFAMALGGTGGTVFPFAIGAIASHAGVKVLQPIILALILVVMIVWLSFPRIKEGQGIFARMRAWMASRSSR